MFRKTKTTALILFALGMILYWGLRIEAAETTEEPTTASAARMAEWNEWKFGLFIHWGPWSQTERGAIWDIGRKFSPEEKKKAFELYKTFNPVKYDPAEWARVAKQAGMRYAVLTTKHHDGFCNWNTKQTDFKITNPDCPYSKSPHPDIVGEYVKAFRDAGLHVGLYYSHIDWHYPDAAWHENSLHYFGKGNYVKEQPDRWKNFVRFHQEQVRELLTNYGRIEDFWFDTGVPGDGKQDLIPTLKMMRQLQPGIIIDNRATGEYADYVTPEQFIPGAPPSGPWETCMTIANGGGFWYKGEKDATYKSPEELVRNLADIASKGGNFLLDTGPRPDGTIPKGEVDSLLGMGEWMKENGEAIYGTHASPWGAAPDWGRITRKGQRLYLIVFEWPKKGVTLPLGLPARQVASARTLKGGEEVSWKPNAADGGVELTLPAKAPSAYASVGVVEFKGELDVKPDWRGATSGRPKSKAKASKSNPSAASGKPIAPDADGVLTLNPVTAVTVGRLVYQADRQNLGAWLDAKDFATWTLSLPEEGSYAVEISYGAAGAENRFAVTAGGQTLEANTVNTGGVKEYKPQAIGRIALPAGKCQLVVKPVGALKGALMNFLQIKLTPVDR